jgi:hypothetical protein
MMKRFIYLSFRVFSAFKYRITRRFTLGGLLVFAGLIASAVTGLDTNQTVAYQVFTFLLTLLCVAIAWAFFFRSPFMGDRILPRFGTVNEPLEYRLIVSNKTNKQQSGLTIRETVEDPRPSFEEFIHTPEPKEKERNPFDRTIGYHRWLWLISKKEWLIQKEEPLPSLPPNSEIEVPMRIVPSHRGHVAFNGFRIARPDPFGLLKSFVTIPFRQSIVILPHRYPLPPINLPGSRRYQPGGVSLASSVGDSEEFISLRDYRPGDPLRRIHWKSWAKTGKPIVKEYQDEFFVRHALILDTFQKTEHSEIFEEAVSIAASFVCSIQTQESLLDLMFVGTEAYCFTSGRGLSHTDNILEILASVKACTNKPFSALPPVVIERASLLSGCICVLISWDEERKKFIDHLTELGVPLLVLVITDDQSSHALDPNSTKALHENLHILHVGKIEEGLAEL